MGEKTGKKRGEERETGRKQEREREREITGEREREREITGERERESTRLQKLKYSRILAFGRSGPIS